MTKLTNTQIEKLEAKGFKRWTKNGMDRLYVNAKALGLKCEYYNTGSVRNAWFRGDSVSNSEARRMMGSKTYIDIETGELHGTHDMLEAAAREVIDGALSEPETETRYEVQQGHLNNEMFSIDVMGEFATVDEALEMFDSIDVRACWLREYECSNGRSVEDECKAVVENVYEWDEDAEEWELSYQGDTVAWGQYTLKDYRAEGL